MAHRGDGREVLVAGEALVDLLLSPGGTVRATLGGGPFNAARAVARLGRPCRYLGQLSADAFGRRLRAALATDGVTMVLPDGVANPTTLALAELDAAGEATYRFYLDGTSAVGLTPDAVSGVMWPGVGAVHVGSLGLAVEPLRSAVAVLVAAAPPDVIVLVDLNCRPAAVADTDRYRSQVRAVAARASVVKASVDDLAFLEPARSAIGAAESLLDEVEDVDAVVVTNGGDPVEVLHRGGRATVAVPRVTVVDSVGAGDCFAAALLCGLLDRGCVGGSVGARPLLAAAADAVIVAAWNCTRAGADPPTTVELASFRASLGEAISP